MGWREAPHFCLLCGRAVLISATGQHVFKCQVCGEYELRRDLIEQLGIDSVWPYPYLSGLAREFQERGERLSLTPDNLQDLKTLAPRGVPEKADRLLVAISRRSHHGGDLVEFRSGVDAALAYADPATGEFGFLLKYLNDSGKLAYFDWNSGVPKCSLSVDGWRRLEELQRTRGLSDQAFVAMWFDPSVRNVYTEGIKPAIEDDTGWKALRVDFKEHIGKVDDEIIADIRESRFIVADFVEHRQSVYFEAGFAMGLGLPVIWTCRKDHIDAAHFDTRQYNHIVWSEPSELRKALALRIRAVIGRGPHSKEPKSS